MKIPLSHADEALGNQIQCTKSFPLLEDGVKRRKPALVPDAVGQGLDCLPADGSLSRAAAMNSLSRRGSVAETIDRESPLALHSIFRRPLGSTISSVTLCLTGITDY